MNSRTTTSLLALAPLLLASPAIAGNAQPALSARDASTLRARDATSLRSLRGGRVDSPSLRGDEKASLRSAEQSAPSLAALRAGDGGGGLLVVALLVVVILLLI